MAMFRGAFEGIIGSEKSTILLNFFVFSSCSGWFCSETAGEGEFERDIVVTV